MRHFSRASGIEYERIEPMGDDGKYFFAWTKNSPKSRLIISAKNIREEKDRQ